MILPEDTINNYQFNNNPQLNELKNYLINYYNSMTLKKYKECQQFLTEEDILMQMPNQIINFYSSSFVPLKTTSQPIVKAKGGFWADDKQLLDQFSSYINTKYKISASPTLKFKDLMLNFTRDTHIETTYTWSSKYESILSGLDIKFEKVVDPRFANKGGNGTTFLYLQEVIDKPKHVLPLEVNKKYEGLIPPINVKPKEYQSTIPKIPKS